MRFTGISFVFHFSLIVGGASLAIAAINLPAIFGDHMVLQREQFNPVWGHADAGEKITVRINGQRATTYAGVDGYWKLKLKPMPAGGPYVLEVSGSSTLQYKDVMVGEVWLCSGQSNMQWSLNQSDGGDMEALSTSNAQLRMISIPHVGSQQKQLDFSGQWECSNKFVAGSFSAVGYHFGRRLQDVLGVTIGLIDNSWGGSSAEAWVPRDVLDAYPRYKDRLDELDEKAATYTDEMHAEITARHEAWKANGRVGKAPPWPNDYRFGQHRPANLYNGVLYPIIGYGMRGVIWYQGEANVSRAENYAHLFPLMISTWRDHWKQGDFSFYWSQLADFTKEQELPQQNSWWASLRAAQTQTLDLPNTGQAVIIDVGEGRDIHPRNKRTVADRLARHALAKDYGFDLACESPRFAEVTMRGSEAVLRFNHVSTGGLYAFDVPEVIGFAIAGADGQFHWAQAKIMGKDKVVVSHPDIDDPVAVRYGWAENPVVNLFDRNGLPVTPFHVDL